MRASMVEVLESDFVEMARLKGMSEQKVVWRHAVPNAIAPAIQVIALNLAYLAGGIVVVEFVFGYPGIGAGFVDAVANRDLPVVLALVGTAIIGPFFAPHAPSEFAGLPYAHPSGTTLLGTDHIGGDVLSRFLWGGRSVLGLSVAATAIGLVLGVTIGLVAAYT